MQYRRVNVSLNPELVEFAEAHLVRAGSFIDLEDCLSAMLSTAIMQAEDDYCSALPAPAELPAASDEIPF